MKTQYKPMAMRCTQEQFDSIKDRIPLPISNDITDFTEIPYLVNNYHKYTGDVYVSTLFSEDTLPEYVHETFDGELFLDCCGRENDETRYVNTTELDELSGGILFILEKMLFYYGVSTQKCAYELEQLFYKTLDAKKDVIIKEYLKNKVWDGSEMQYRSDISNSWSKLVYVGNDEFRIKPNPDYSKEIEALERTDIKTIIVKKKHDVKIEDEHKYKDLPSNETITVFTLHKEFYDLDKEEKIKILKGLIDFSTDEIGEIRYKI